MLLQKGLPISEGSLLGCSAATGMTKALSRVDGGSTKGKAERGLLMGVGNQKEALKRLREEAEGVSAHLGGPGTWLVLGSSSSWDHWWRLCYS
jgi:hypothetical protein